MSITDAIKLVHFLTTDITSDRSQIHWSFHPERGNLNVFVGSGLNEGKNHVVIQKRTFKDGIDVLFEFYDGPILKSFLLQLYVQVAPRVIEHAFIHRTGGKTRRVFYHE